MRVPTCHQRSRVLTPVILCLALSLGVPGPNVRGGDATSDQPFSEAPTENTPTPESRYRLNAGDIIEIRFFFHPELSDQVQVRPDGWLSLPLVGDIQFAGRTVAEAEAALEEVYEGELRNPRIWIQIRSYGAQTIYVTGEVLRPGMQSLVSDKTLMGAIGEAGGISLTGHRKKVVVIRKGDDGLPVLTEVRLVERGDPTADSMMLLQPQDVVIVPESKIARVDRWIDQNIRKLIPVHLSAQYTYLVAAKNRGLSF